MLSLGIIWNKAYEYKREIISDIEGRVKLLECFDLDLNDDYEGFVKEIYQNENMEDWKIDRKINAMCPCDSKKISVVIFEFDSSRVVYHEFKHKDVYEELESLEMYIREKYSKLVDNYVFDIIFHSTVPILLKGKIIKFVFPFIFLIFTGPIIRLSLDTALLSPITKYSFSPKTTLSKSFVVVLL